MTDWRLSRSIRVPLRLKHCRGARRGSPWQVLQRVDHPDPAAANAEALNDSRAARRVLPWCSRDRWQLWLWFGGVAGGDCSRRSMMFISTPASPLELDLGIDRKAPVKRSPRS